MVLGALVVGGVIGVGKHSAVVSTHTTPTRVVPTTSQSSTTIPEVTTTVPAAVGETWTDPSSTLSFVLPAGAHIKVTDSGTNADGHRWVASASGQSQHIVVLALDAVSPQVAGSVVATNLAKAGGHQHAVNLGAGEATAVSGTAAAPNGQLIYATVGSYGYIIIIDSDTSGDPQVDALVSSIRLRG